MTNSFEKKRKAMEEERIRQDFESMLNRARSVMVGTAFGGVTEISMRSNDGRVLWTPMQPVEVTELIHQLAANIGCHIHLTPRDDFASWRNWRVTEQQHKHLRGHPPHPNDISPHVRVGTDKFTQKDQLLTESFFPPEMVKNEYEKELENAVAAQKDLNRRTIESTPTST